jgi:hypothetical protein
MDKKALFSTLWIFVTLNYLYCDVMGLMDPDLLKQYLTGSVNGMDINAGFLLGAAILMEIPIGLVLLSRILNHRRFYHDRGPDINYVFRETCFLLPVLRGH